MHSVSSQSQAVKMTATTIPTGATFGRLTVIGLSHRVHKKCGTGHRYYYLCRCECGTDKVASANDLLCGDTTSCGCHRQQVIGALNRTHGESHTRLYEIWMGMHKRCLNPKDKLYPYYGGRGIAICQEWETYATFRDWALTHGYADTLSLDRQDNEGPYSPDNCRWTTDVEQGRNKRNNLLVTAFGETKCLAAWAEDARCRVSYGTLQCRLARGWQPERSIITPRIPTGRHR